MDYHARSALFPRPLFRTERTIEDFAAYYGAILLSEFAACFLVGRVVTSHQYEAIADNARGSIEDVVGNGPRYGNQLPWYILSQIVQVAGTAMGMVGSCKPTIVHWSGISDQSKTEMDGFSKELSDLKVSHPVWDTPTCIARFTERCKTFSKTL